MISIDPAILLIIGEVMLALLAGIGLISFLFVRNRKRDKAAIEVLESRLKKNSSTREQMYSEMIKSASSDEEAEVDNEEDEAFKEQAKEWVKKENKLYGHLIDMYVKRDTAMVSSLDKLLHEYTSSYLDVVVDMRTRLNEQQISMDEETQATLSRLEAQGEVLRQELEGLKEENARLAKELQNAENEIDQTVREYASAFRASEAAAMVGGAAATAVAAGAVEAGAVEASAVEASAEAAVEPESEPAPSSPEPVAEDVPVLADEAPAEISPADTSNESSESLVEDVVEDAGEPQLDDMDEALAGLEALSLTEESPTDVAEPEVESVETAETVDELASPGVVIDLAEDEDISSLLDGVAEVMPESIEENLESDAPVVSAEDDALPADGVGDDLALAEESVVDDVGTEEAVLDALALVEEGESPDLELDSDEDDRALADLVAGLEELDETEPLMPDLNVAEEDTLVAELDALVDVTDESTDAAEDELDPDAIIAQSIVPENEESESGAKEDDGVDDDLLAQLQKMNMSGEDEPNIEDLVMGNDDKDKK